MTIDRKYSNEFLDLLEWFFDLETIYEYQKELKEMVEQKFKNSTIFFDTLKNDKNIY